MQSIVGGKPNVNFLPRCPFTRIVVIPARVLHSFPDGLMKLWLECVS